MIWSLMKNGLFKHGKALTGNLSGIWRYRIGGYRLFAEIQDDKLIIFLIEVGYKKKS